MAAAKKTKKKKAAAQGKSSVKRSPAKTSKKAAAKKKAASSKPVRKAAAKKSGATTKKASLPKSASPARKVPAAMQKRHDQLKKLLFRKRNEVVEGLESQMGRKLIRETGQKIDSAMDSADQSALDVDQGIDYSLLEMKYEQYKDIADAFRKLQAGTYGLCEECEEEIDIKRLEVNPLARYCIACKTRREEMEKIQREETRFKE